MGDETFRFWLIPISALVIVVIIFGFTLEYKINTILPSAEIEIQELRDMTCEEITAKNSIGSFWTPDNAKWTREKVITCKEAKDTIQKLERDRLNLLLADPNSQESLEKKLLEIMDQDNFHRQLLFEHEKQVQILQGNVTHLENEFDITLDKMDNLGYLDNDGCIEMIRVNDIPMSTCK